MDFLFNALAVAWLLGLALLHNLWRAMTLSQKSGKGKSPPEPSGAWPLIGHLPLLGAGGRDPVARTLGAIADNYGPIFTIKLGVHPVLVVSSWEAVKDCFTTNDRAFAKRPNSSHGVYLGYNYAGFGFTHGPYWRKIRKLVLVELLSSRRLNTLQHVRVSELNTSIKELYSLAKKSDCHKDNPAKVVMSEWFEQLTLNVIARMIAGKRYFGSSDGATEEEAKHFRRVIKEFMYISGEFVLSDVIPFPLLRWIDLQGHLKSMKRISKEVDSIAKTWFNQHLTKRLKNEPAGDEQDFIDVLLSVIDDTSTYGHSRETIIKATIMTLILAGADTTSINLTWLLSLLLNNGHALQLAKEEIDINVGKDRWVEDSDIKNLVYLQSIVKETLRLYPPGPLAVPHEALEDCEVGGYHIPKGTRLFVNVWKLHRDPRIWSDPEKFMPERFLTGHSEVDVSGQHFEFTPFGSGRRSCPGLTFAMQVTHLTLARLIQGFELSTPLNVPVDLTEGQGITLPKATPLEILITPRLRSELYGQ